MAADYCTAPAGLSSLDRPAWVGLWESGPNATGDGACPQATPRCRRGDPSTGSAAFSSSPAIVAMTVLGARRAASATSPTT